MEIKAKQKLIKVHEKKLKEAKAIEKEVRKDTNIYLKLIF